MIREVYPNLFVGDAEGLNADLKRLAGYVPGISNTWGIDCSECGKSYLGATIDDGPNRCLDCALKHIAENWFIIHAAKEPWHRNALGYTERGAPPNHPEYLVAKRDGELMLNLVDMPKISPQYTNPIVEAAFEAIDENLIHAGKRVLIHCNEGKSRAPTIALLYLGVQEDLQATPFDVAVEKFRALYPEYEPGAGMEAYARQRWGYVEEPTDGAA